MFPAKSLTQLLSIQTPLFNAPMVDVFGPHMVAAVSNAGGLGVVPGDLLEPAELSRFVEQVRSLTDKPFAIALDVDESPEASRVSQSFLTLLSPLLEELGLLEQGSDDSLLSVSSVQERFACAIDMHPQAMIALHGGFREPEADQLSEKGIVNMAVFTTLREAKVLRAAGAQALIAQGYEASGVRCHFEDGPEAGTGLLSLIPSAVRATGLPIVAWGGLALPVQAQAVAQLGASGVMLGTGLIDTQESDADDVHRYYATYGQMSDTVLTSIFHGKTSRVLRNALFEALAPYADQIGGHHWQRRLMWKLHQRAKQLQRNDLMIREVGTGLGSAHYADVARAINALMVSKSGDKVFL